VAIPSFLWIQQGFGLTAVFVVIAVIVVIAAVAVTQIGPEAKGLALRLAPLPVEPILDSRRPNNTKHPAADERRKKVSRFSRIE
jgi:hypothetical protein